MELVNKHGNLQEGEADLLVMGIGNVLLGDEGVGVHAIRVLEEMDWPGHVRFLDGGTGGFHLLSVFQQYKKIIMIDAALDDEPPGSIRILQPKYAADFPKTLSSHDIGLRDLVNSSALLGFLPEIALIVVSITSNQPISMELTPAVEGALPAIVKIVLELAGER